MEQKEGVSCQDDRRTKSAAAAALLKARPAAAAALAKLTESGFEAFIVGGCVRDCLMGTVPGDIDITTNAGPDDMLRIFAGMRTVASGLKHGTLTVILAGEAVEITAYRKESAYSDRRHPDTVTFTGDIADDLSRRDFTVNAIAYAPARGIVDPYNGSEDIEKGLIRCVGDAAARFKEDALRIMRALRFAAVLGFEIEAQTESALFADKDLLRGISAERIAAELMKLLNGRFAAEVILKYTDILAVVIPELAPMKGFDQHSPHHRYDVLTHTALAVHNVPATDHIRLAALLHDVGKPLTFTLDENGRGHFYGHEKAGADMAGVIMERLRFSNDTRDKVARLIRLHMKNITPAAVSVKKALAALGEEQFYALMALKRADAAAKGTGEDDMDVFDRINATAAAVLASGECFSAAKLAVNGDDLLGLGYSGPRLGAMLSELLAAVIAETMKNDKITLLKYAKDKLRDENRQS